MVLVNLFAEKEWSPECREQTCGESGTNGEGGINIYTLSGVRWIAGEKVL